MTQLVNKASSWRTLRHKVVVGASSIALVAGMGVALAPAATAANAGDVTLSVAGTSPEPAFPAETVLGTPSVGSYTVTIAGSGNLTAGNTKKSDGTDVANTFAVRVVASGTNLGLARGNGVFTALTLGGAVATGVLPLWSATLANGTSNDSNTVTAISSAITPLTAGGPVTAALTLTATQAVGKSWAGLVNFNVSVVEVAGTGSTVEGQVQKSLGSTSFSTTLAEEAAPTAYETTAATTTPPAHAKLALKAAIGKDFSGAVVKSFGVPAADPAFSAGDITVTGTGVVAPTGDATVWGLGNGFSFDAKTGAISAAAAAVKDPGKTSAVFTVKVNNGVSPAAEVDVTVKQVFVDDASIAKDLENEVYKGAVDGITEGYADGTFKPASSVTRVAFAAFAARYLKTVAGQNVATDLNLMCDASSPSGFSDVANNAPGCAVIRDLKKAGVTDGYADGTFRSGNTITRQAIAAMLYRLDQINRGVPVTDAAAPATAPFNDVAASAPFAGEIAWAAGKNLTKGYDDGGFHPAANSSRQATVVFMVRLGAL